MNLQLEVFINERPQHMIGAFVMFGGGRIGATRNELEDVGLHVAAGRDPADIVMLDEIPGLKYKYVEQSQGIYFTVDNAMRKGARFDLSQSAERARVERTTGWGAVVNYDAITTGGAQLGLRGASYDGGSLTFDSRVFSPYGTLSQSGVFLSTPLQGPTFDRLDTTYQFSDPERAIAYRAGDAITGSLAWTRPLRIGGLQAQRNFSLRPDLITTPLPSIGGIAAVPSTIDVYVNNVRTFTQDVAPGPFSVNNIPTISGGGNAELVLRDSSGREVKSAVPFYSSADLLVPGTIDWSLEAGFPRLSYGSDSDAYGRDPVASASLRGGLFDGLTGQAHVEGAERFVNGGLGAVVTTGTFGLASLALAGSLRPGASGAQAYAAYETKLLGVAMTASSQRTFGVYDDLVSATARLRPLSFIQLQAAYGLYSNAPGGVFVQNPNPVAGALSSIYDDARPPLALDRVSFSAPIPFDPKTSVSAGFIHLLDATGARSEILNGSISRAMPFNAALSLSAFHDFGSTKSTGFVVSFSMPFGESASASSSASLGQGRPNINTDVIRPLGAQPGDYGWSVMDNEGAQSSRGANVSYRSTYGTIAASANNSGPANVGSLEMRGSLVAMGDGVFASNWIDDGFAVVKVGAPDVPVLSENRLVGVTGANGMLLAPSLRSFQRNSVSVDPANLPVDAEIETTRDVASPADRAGVVVDFSVRHDTDAALVTFTLADGAPVPAGAAGHIENGTDFTVGYDGQAFIRKLSSSNAVRIEIPGGACSTSFSFTPRPGEQVRVAAPKCVAAAEGASLELRH